MSPYIHFTEEQKEQAASVDLEEFLRRKGERLITSGRDKRLSSDHSVTIRGNEWFDHAICQGGHAISFVQKFYGMNYQDAMLTLLNDEMGMAFPLVKDRMQEQPKPFSLPEANKDMRRVFAYLVKQRQIDRDIVAHFARANTLYEDAKYHNAVFVGVDESGTPRHAHKRSTNSFGQAFRINIEGSDPRYSFHHKGNDGSLYVFEAPIDMLSYMTLFPNDWQAHSYVSCCGTSAQPVIEMLRQTPDIETVYLCLDNDAAGHAASQRITEQLLQNGITSVRLSPNQKDWNDELVSQINTESEVDQKCQTFGLGLSL